MNEWISVKDSLPKDGSEWCLVSVVRNGKQIVITGTQFLFMDGKFCSPTTNSTYTISPISEKVTHWMSLPLPPIN